MAVWWMECPDCDLPKAISCRLRGYCIRACLISPYPPAGSASGAERMNADKASGETIDHRRACELACPARGSRGHGDSIMKVLVRTPRREEVREVDSEWVIPGDVLADG